MKLQSISKISYDDFAMYENTFQNINVDKNSITITTEEELNEYTMLPNVMTVVFNKTSNKAEIEYFNDVTIQSWINNYGSSMYIPISLYYAHNDGTFTLLWNDGKMIEE